jgi:adenosylhomocysteinase
VYDIPREQDQIIALAKLKSMNIDIDTLTQEQETYLNGFSQGT